MTIILNLRARN